MKLNKAARLMLLCLFVALIPLTLQAEILEVKIITTAVAILMSTIMFLVNLIDDE